jgi:hypothetical protein
VVWRGSGANSGDVDPPSDIPSYWDPCPRRTRGNLPCGKPRYHRGNCSPSLEILNDYREYAKHIRERAETMTVSQLEEAMEFHLLAWRVLRAEMNRR